MMDSIVETSTSAAPRGSALRPQSVPRTQHTGWVFGLRPKISQRDHGFLRLRLRQPCSRWLTGVLHVQRLGGSGRLGVPEESRSSRRGSPSLEVAGGREGGRRHSRGAEICGGRAEGGFSRPRAGCSSGGCRAMPWPRPKRRRSRGAPRFSRAVPLGAISAGRLRGFRGVPVVRGGVVSKV